MNYLSDYSTQLIKNGYDIVPLRASVKTKAPFCSDWTNREKYTIEDVEAFTAVNGKGFGVGVRNRHTPAIDLDVNCSKVVKQLTQWISENLGESPQRIGQAPKVLMFFRCTNAINKIQSKKYMCEKGLTHRIEILGDGQQSVAFALHPVTSLPYVWPNSSILSVDHADLPLLTKAQALDLITFFESIVPKDWTLVSNSKSVANTEIFDQSISLDQRSLLNLKRPLALTRDKINSVLAVLNCEERDSWIECGMALHHQFRGDNEGFELWSNWSAQSSKFDESEMEAKWASFEADLCTQNPVTFATLIHTANELETPAFVVEKRKGFHFKHVSETHQALSAINWLVKGFIETNSTGLLFGDPASYKSFLAIDLALCVASGQHWHNNRTKRGPVFYIAGEGQNGLARRVGAWSKANNKVLSDLPFFLSSTSANLLEVTGITAIINAIDAATKGGTPPAMIVVDTLARNFGAGDENSTSDMNVFIEHVDSYLRAKYECVVLIVHHTGRGNKDRARGSIALTGGVDFEYRLARKEGTEIVELSNTKMKDAREPDAMFFKARSIDLGSFVDDEGNAELVDSLVLEVCDAPVQIVEIDIKEGSLQDKLFTRIQEILKVSDSECKKAIKNDVVGLGILTDAQYRAALKPLLDKRILVEIDGFIEIDALYK